MQVFYSPSEIPADFGPTVASIGNFDGVHVGHRSVIDRMRKSAASQGARSVVVTFDPHPLRFLRPETCPRLITPLKTRLELLADAGLDAVLVLPFTANLSRMRAAEFITTIVHDVLGAVEVHEGPNFRFGYQAEGGTAELSRFGEELGFRVVIHSALQIRGITVSSSKIRQLLSEGDLRLARMLLGHGFFVDSTLAAGRGIGTKMTVPTINLATYAELLPPNGVYVTRMRVGEEWFHAVTNVGNRPTFGADSFAVESYLLDFRPMTLEADTPLRLLFLHFLREEKQWSSAEALKEQILRDVAKAKRYLRLYQRFSG